jgi:hypothetical protein
VARLVLNADDFGASADTVEATIACVERGALTSATIMPRAPATDEAIAFARGRSDISFGVHLTLVRDQETSSVLEPAALGGLVDGDGRFMPTNRFRARALLHQLPTAELEREIAAQIAAVREQGVAVSHVDSHRHVHKLPAVREALARVLPELGIRRVRTVQDVYLRRPLLSPTVWLGPRWGRALERRFTTTDHLYMPTTSGDRDWHDALVDVVARIGPRSLEIGVHPGGAEDWRAAERDSVIAFATAARERGYELVPWSGI